MWKILKYNDYIIFFIVKVQNSIVIYTASCSNIYVFEESMRSMHEGFAVVIH
jgi:hypothetical protein